MLRAVDEVNAAPEAHCCSTRSMQHFGEHLRGKRFAVWGLAFKPRTDDMREAPAVTLIEALLEAGAEVQAHDPEALDEARRIFGDASSTPRSTYDALDGADALLMVTEWHEFRSPTSSA